MQMAIFITGTEMTSDITATRAEFREHATADGRGAWIVSDEPDQLLTCEEAFSAMRQAGAGEETTMTAAAAWELPESLLSAIRKSQEITLHAIRAWAGAAGYVTVKVPGARLPFASLLPRAHDVVASSFDFAGQVLASQRRFAGEVLAAGAESRMPGLRGPAWLHGSSHRKPGLCRYQPRGGGAQAHREDLAGPGVAAVPDAGGILARSARNPPGRQELQAGARG